MKKLLEYKNLIIFVITLGFLSYWFTQHPRQLGGIFDFVLIFLLVIFMGGGLLIPHKEGEEWELKDMFKLMLFVGIIVYFLT